MKKQLLYLGAISMFFIGAFHANAQCLEALNGQYPDAILVPECVGAPENLVSDAYASEYSLVQLIAGEPYIFSSSIVTDYVTISDEAGTFAYAFGVSPVSYTPTASGVVRFYLHTDAQCGEESSIRARRVQCGSVPTCEPSSIPYTQGFENGETACITYLDVNGSTELSGWEINNIFPTDFGNRSMLYSYDGQLPGDDWFFTGGLALTAGVSYTLQFKYRSGLGPEIVENLEVKYGQAATVAGMTTPLLSFVNLSTNFGNPFDTATVSMTPTTTGTYFIGFRSFSIADQGYIQIDNITVDVNLATDSFTKNTLSYYPNPVKDVLTFSNVERFTGISIYNLLGQKVLSQDGTVNQIDLSSLNSGAYIVKLTDGISVKSLKIIKE